MENSVIKFDKEEDKDYINYSETLISLQNKNKILLQNLNESDEIIDNLDLDYQNEKRNNESNLKKLKEYDIKNKKNQHLILELENTIHELKLKIDKIETENNTLKRNKKLPQNSLLEPLLNNEEEKIYKDDKNLKNNTILVLEILEKDNELLNSKVDQLEKTILELQNTLQYEKNISEKLIIDNENMKKDFLESLNNFNKQKEKECYINNHDLTFEDELYILEKKNNIKSLEDEINALIAQKNDLNFQIFEQKGIISILEQQAELIKENKHKKKPFYKKLFCCFF
jgi:hypothetical protein